MGTKKLIIFALHYAGFSVVFGDLAAPALLLHRLFLRYLRNGAWLQWRINRKLHMRFRLLPKLSTLDDLQRPIRTPLQKRCVFWSPLQKFERKYTHTINRKYV